VVIFVHGSPGAAKDFNHFLADEALLQKATLVAVDRPGFGFSGYGNGVDSLAGQSVLLQPLLEKFREEKKKIILAGHSLGGPLIVRMAADNPQLADGLIIAAGSADPQLEPAEWFRPFLASRTMRRIMPPWLRASNAELMHHRSDLQDLLPLWSSVCQPVIIVHGTKDKLVPVGNASFAKERLINSTFADLRTVPGIGHLFIWLHPEILKEAVEDMIAKARLDVRYQI
jgi:pimeloyl-ACP methyl ester carboxylesterase